MADVRIEQCSAVQAQEIDKRLARRNRHLLAADGTSAGMSFCRSRCDIHREKLRQAPTMFQMTIYGSFLRSQNTCLRLTVLRSREESPSAERRVYGTHVAPSTGFCSVTPCSSVDCTLRRTLLRILCRIPTNCSAEPNQWRRDWDGLRLREADPQSAADRPASP